MHFSSSLAAWLRPLDLPSADPGSTGRRVYWGDRARYPDAEGRPYHDPGADAIGLKDCGSSI